MALLDFLKTKKEAVVEKQFVGRHQQTFFIKQIFGENASDMERQIAVNKDLGERNEIAMKLEKVEEYVHSDYFTNQFDVSSASKDIENIIDEGYKTCVLPNDIDLENRCLKILRDTIEYTKRFGLKHGTLTVENAAKLDDILNLRVAAGYLNWWTLGDLPLNGDEQHAWMIISSLLNTGKPIGGFDKSDLVAGVLATLSLKDVIWSAEQFKKIKEKLLHDGKINQTEAKRVDELIKKGLAQNKKIHEEHPDRP